MIILLSSNKKMQKCFQNIVFIPLVTCIQKNLGSSAESNPVALREALTSDFCFRRISENVFPPAPITIS